MNRLSFLKTGLFAGLFSLFGKEKALSEPFSEETEIFALRQIRQWLDEGAVIYKNPKAENCLIVREDSKVIIGNLHIDAGERAKKFIRENKI